MGKENNTNQTYIKVDILVEQSRFWVYQTPLVLYKL